MLVTNPLNYKVMVDYQSKRIMSKIIDRNEKEAVYEMKEDEYRAGGGKKK